jgi:hypothetical protein
MAFHTHFNAHSMQHQPRPFFYCTRFLRFGEVWKPRFHTPIANAHPLQHTKQFEQGVKCLHTVLDIVIDNALNLERSTRKPYARH